MLRDARAGEMPALNSALLALQELDLPDQQDTGAPAFRRHHAACRPACRLAPLRFGNRNQRRRRVWPIGPEANERSSGFGRQIFDAALRLSIKLQDSFIDQLMETEGARLGRAQRRRGFVGRCFQYFGWPAAAADAMDDYIANVSKLNTTWAELKDLASGLPLPPHFTQAMDKAEHDFFDPDYIDMRTNALKALVAGQTAGHDGRAMVADVGVQACRLSKASPMPRSMRPRIMPSSSTRARCATSSCSFGLLAVSLGVVIGMLLAVSRRVISPLHKVSDAMRQLAGGDFGVVLPGLERNDEIGAIAAPRRDSRSRPPKRRSAKRRCKPTVSAKPPIRLSAKWRSAPPSRPNRNARWQPSATRQ